MGTAIIIGLVIALCFHEIYGLSPGGFIVPGYLGFFLMQPRIIVLSLLFAVLTMLLLRWLEQKMLLYGRRKLLAGVLLGALITEIAKLILEPSWFDFESYIGVIVPGMIAVDIDTQGIGATLLALIPAAIIVRLIIEISFRTGLL